MEFRERQPLLQTSSRSEEKLQRSRSWWSSLTFSWVNPLLETGIQRQLQQEDLLTVPPDLAPKLCCGQLWRCWDQERKCHSNNPSLLWAIFNAYGRVYLFLGLLKVLSSWSNILTFYSVELNGLAYSYININNQSVSV